MPAHKKSSSIIQFLLTFLVVYLITTLGLRVLFPQRFQSTTTQKDAITLTPEKHSFPLGRKVSVKVHNTTDAPIVLPDRCPAPPFRVERKKEADADFSIIELSKPVIPCSPLTTLPPDTTVNVDLGPWMYEGFWETGRYRLTLPLDQPGSGSTIFETTIVIKDLNVLIGAFRAFISKPILNGLILIASLLPYHSLGWSIIILTIIVKLILFFPTQHALESQKRLQSLQPKIEEIKRKYKDDQKRVTEETMHLWKQEKINPLQSCLPTLLQIPVLLGLFFVIRDSGSLELVQHLLYKPFDHIEWHFATQFLGLFDLTSIPFEGITWAPTRENISLIVRGLPLPLIIALLQFAQMWLAFSTTKKKEKEEVKNAKPGVAETQQKIMLYALPVMLFVFSGTFQAAVSIYWGASTAFAILQQLFVNKRTALRSS